MQTRHLEAGEGTECYIHPPFKIRIHPNNGVILWPQWIQNSSSSGEIPTVPSQAFPSRNPHASGTFRLHVISGWNPQAGELDHYLELPIGILTSTLLSVAAVEKHCPTRRSCPTDLTQSWYIPGPAPPGRAPISKPAISAAKPPSLLKMMNSICFSNKYAHSSAEPHPWWPTQTAGSAYTPIVVEAATRGEDMSLFGQGTSSFGLSQPSAAPASPSNTSVPARFSATTDLTAGAAQPAATAISWASEQTTSRSATPATASATLANVPFGFATSAATTSVARPPAHVPVAA